MSDLYDIPTGWTEPEGLHELLQEVLAQRPDANVSKIRHAYYIAEVAHQGQKRASGEPYIIHPLKVAEHIVSLKLDDDSIVAALLHDVIEDCPQVRPEIISEIFGDDVKLLVEGVTKLSFHPAEVASPKQKALTESWRAGETLRKMLLAMSKDLRVMVIKLADRLHNMQTLDALSPERQTRIANQTLEVYAPLAARLGIWQFKWQLEDLAFKTLHPTEFYQISERVAKSRKEREEELRDAILLLKERLEQKGLKVVDVHGRPKHLYSIFNKMVKQGVRFEDIYDLLAIRVIVENVSDCYVALGVVHDLWMPVPGLFYDYIAKPKPNGYQSLHTKIVGPNGEPFEVQIRTKSMHEVAEHGVAAHWTYKEGRVSIDETSRISALRQNLVDWSTESKSGTEFLRSVSSELFGEQVFVFTPKGDVLELPKDSTPVDFAFRVHTELGLRMVGARVNGVIVPLNTKLHNGDVIELITRSNAQPSIDWLEFVKSAHARSKLRQHFRRLSRIDDASRGRDLLEREFKALRLEPRDYIGEEKLTALAKTIEGCENAVDLLAKIGAGLISLQMVVMKLRGVTAPPAEPKQIQTSKTKEGSLTLSASGVDNVLIKRGKCCDPIPGDDVLGYVTCSRGITIHRKTCPNVAHFQSTQPERMMPLKWPTDGSFYEVAIRILAVNRSGLLMDISTIFGEAKTNVSSARVRTLPNQTAEIEMDIDVTDTNHLAQLLLKINQLSDVIKAKRLEVASDS